MRLPGYNAYIGIRENSYCCILVFDWNGKAEFLGIDWHDSAQDIDDAIQKAIPTAYIQYFVPHPLALSPAFGCVTVRPLDCPIMAFASRRAFAPVGNPGNPPSPRPEREDERKLVEKLLDEMI